ncbi:hypothetical protein BC943DRAFT_314186 [Umbelopsis sp. AD052]|nr:hypothetical protein BC943DRAFT_314186 [Umbelopsis sp. AD052]
MADLTTLNYNDIIGTCNRLKSFFAQYTSIIIDASNGIAKTFHAQLPKILAEIFGSSTKRGWLQIATTKQEDKAVYELLEPNGPFFTCILQMQYQRHFAYEILPNKLPANIQAFFKPSAYHLLPPIYSDRMQIYSPEQMSFTDSSNPFRQLSASQAAMGRRIAGASTGITDIKLTFSAYEFFIFNFLHGAIWNTYKQELAKPFPHMTFPTQAFGQRHAFPPSKPAQPQPKCMLNTMYAPLLEAYVAWALPTSAGGMKSRKEESNFFFQAASEVWVNETIPSYGQRLADEVLFCIATLSRATMQQDLRKATSVGKFHSNSDVISFAYTSMKDCMYIWLKEAIKNWPLEDSFLEIVNLWSIWAAPWRFGDPARSEADDKTKPIDEGWGLYIAHNFLFYHTLVELLLLRSAKYGYAENAPRYHYVIRSIATRHRDNGSVKGEVRSLLRLVNVLSLEGIVPLLSEIEQALTTQSNAQTGAARHDFGIHTPILLTQVDPAISAILPELRSNMAVLEGPEWSPPTMYSKYMPGAKNPIDEALLALKQAIYLRFSMLPKQHTAGSSSGDSNWRNIVATTSHVAPLSRASLSPEAASRVRKQATEMQRLAQSLGMVFNIPAAELEHLALAGSIDDDTAASQLQSRKGPVRTLFAQISQQVRQRGFLSSEGKKEVQEGLRKCSNLDVPALGPRAEHMVRSYEVAMLIPYVVWFDRHLNRYYQRFVPETSTVFPPRLTIRPIAAWINLAYLLLIILLWRWLFS